MPHKGTQDDKGNTSSMRWMVYTAIAIDIWLVALMSASIIANIVRNVPVDWQGLALYMGAIAAVTSGVAWAKAHQKKHENENH